MSTEGSPTFASVDEQLRHWKAEAEAAQADADALQEEIDELLKAQEEQAEELTRQCREAKDEARAAELRAEAAEEASRVAAAGETAANAKLEAAMEESVLLQSELEEANEQLQAQAAAATKDSGPPTGGKDATGDGDTEVGVLKKRVAELERQVEVAASDADELRELRRVAAANARFRSDTVISEPPHVGEDPDAPPPPSTAPPPDSPRREAEAELEEIRRSLADAEAMNEELLAEVETMSQDIIAKDNKIAALQESPAVGAHEEDNKRLKQQVADLTEQLERRAAEVSELREAAETAKAAATSAMARAEAADEKLVSSDERKATLSADLADAENRVSAAQLALKAAETQNAELLATSTKKEADLCAKLKAAQDEADAARSEREAAASLSAEGLRKLEAAQSATDQLKQQVERLTQAVKSAEKEAESSKADAVAAERARKSASDALSQAETDLAELRASVEKLKAEAEEVHASEAAANEARDAALQKASAAEAAAAAAQEGVTRSTAAAAAAEVSRSAATAVAEKSRNDAETARSEVAKAKVTAKEEREARQEAEAGRAAAQAELAAASSRLASLETRLEDTTCRLEEARAAVEVAEKRANEAEVALSAGSESDEARVKAQQERVAAAVATAEASQQSADEAARRADALGAELASARAESTEAKKRVEELTERVDELEVEARKAASVNDALKARFAAADKERVEALEAASGTALKLKFVERGKAAAEKTAAEAASATEALQAELLETQAQVSGLNAKLATAETEARATTARLSELETELQSARAAARENLTAAETASQTVAQLEDDVGALRTELSDKVSENDASRKLADELQEKLSEAQVRADEATRALADAQKESVASSDVETDLQDAQRRAEAADLRISELEGELEAAVDLAKEHAERVEELTAKLAAATKTSETGVLAAERLSAKVRELEAQLAKEAAAHQKDTSQASVEAAQLDTAAARVAELEAGQKEHTSALAEQVELAEAATERTRELENELQAAQQRAAEAEFRIVELETQVEAANEHSQSVNETSAAKEARVAADIAALELEVEAARASATNGEEGVELLETKERLAEAEARIEELEVQLLNAQLARRRDSTDGLAVSPGDVASPASSRASAAPTSTSPRSAGSRPVESSPAVTASAFEEQVERLRKELAQATEKLAEEKSAHARAERDLAELRDTTTAQANRIKELSGGDETTRRKERALQQQIQSLREELEKRKKRIVDLQRVVQRMERDRERELEAAATKEQRRREVERDMNRGHVAALEKEAERRIAAERALSKLREEQSAALAGAEERVNAAEATVRDVARRVLSSVTDLSSELSAELKKLQSWQGEPSAHGTDSEGSTRKTTLPTSRSSRRIGATAAVAAVIAASPKVQPPARKQPGPIEVGSAVVIDDSGLRGVVTRKKRGGWWAIRLDDGSNIVKRSGQFSAYEPDHSPMRTLPELSSSGGAATTPEDGGSSMEESPTTTPANGGAGAASAGDTTTDPGPDAGAGPGSAGAAMPPSTPVTPRMSLDASDSPAAALLRTPLVSPSKSPALASTDLTEVAALFDDATAQLLRDVCAQVAQLEHFDGDIRRMLTGSGGGEPSAASPATPVKRNPAAVVGVAISALRDQLSALRVMACFLRDHLGEALSRMSLSVAALIQHMADTYMDLLRENSALLSRVQRSRRNIAVYVRIRPPTASELAADERNTMDVLSEAEMAFWEERHQQWRPFAFDRVLGPDVTNPDVFRELEDVAATVVDGHRACILAYGQTGAGKTYTMEGPRDDPGINYRILHKLFGLTRQRRGVAYSLRVSMLEVYNEVIRDLLVRDDSSPAKLDVRYSREHGVTVPNITQEAVNSAEDVLRVLARGNENRAVAATSVHEYSSRSHMVLVVEVVGKPPASVDAPETRGKLYLVDLAGSERVRKSEVTGARMREAQHINKSLSALGDVLMALDQKTPHVPYRNSRLTRLLQDALTGSSHTLIVCNVCPTVSNAEETLFTLQFAARARRVELGPAQKTIKFKNAEEKARTLRHRLEVSMKERARLETEVAHLKKQTASLEGRVAAVRESERRTQADRQRSNHGQLDALKTEKSELNAKLRAAKAKHQRDMEELRASQKRIAHEKHVSATKDRELEAMTHKVMSLESDLARLRAALSESKAELAHARRDVASATKAAARAAEAADRTPATTRRLSAGGESASSTAPPANGSMFTPSPVGEPGHSARPARGTPASVEPPVTPSGTRRSARASARPATSAGPRPTSARRERPATAPGRTRGGGARARDSGRATPPSEGVRRRYVERSSYAPKPSSRPGWRF